MKLTAIFEERLLSALQKRKRSRLLSLYGGIQTCPWCRQIAQSQKGCGFSCYDADQSLDVLTCGVCEGESLWMFGMGMHFIKPLSHPAGRAALAQGGVNDD